MKWQFVINCTNCQRYYFERKKVTSAICHAMIVSKNDHKICFKYTASAWLGRWFLVQTFDEDDDRKIERDIREIRELLDGNEPENTKEPRQ